MTPAAVVLAAALMVSVPAAAQQTARMSHEELILERGKPARWFSKGACSD
jgi:hypothetical protein